MAIKLKSKITWGVLFLFILLLLVGGTGFFYLNKSTSEQRDILKENYETLDYARGMLEVIDDPRIDAESAKIQFEENLRGQEQNVTEPGEEYLTRKLRSDYSALRSHPDSMELETALRSDITGIMLINLMAISEKNKILDQSSDNAKFIITLLLTLSAIGGLVFVYNFPGYIANPIVKLTEGIKAIAGKKYSERIHLNRKDEFGEMAVAFNHMAEELDKFEHSNLAQILFEKQRAEAVINSLQDASIGVGKNGTILFANPQMLQLLGLAETAVVGQKEKILQQQNDLFRFLAGEDNSQPFKIVVDNKEAFFTKETVAITNTEGSIGYMIVLRNITPYKERDVAKTNFIATVSHELKTPLAASDFSLKLLEDERVGSLNAEQKELVQNLKTDNQRLLKILSELLDLSQVESGKIQLHIAAIDAVVPVQRAIEAVTAAAQQKHILLQASFAENLRLCKGDEEKLAWVLTNFLTNAIKFSPENSKINIGVSNEAETLVFSVTDEGKGIAPEYLPKIFDRFYQVPGTEKTGTGLGLSISKEFIEAMGGTTGAKSEPGQGSRFYFSLPVA